MTSQNLDTRLSAASSSVISLFRAVIGFLFAAHGSSILFGWPIAMKFPVGLSAGWVAGLIEFTTGLLVLVGLLTRPAAFLASGTMAVAYFWQHQPYALWPLDPSQNAFHKPVGGGELAILFCFSFFLLVFIGPGRIAVDSMLRRRH